MTSYRRSFPSRSYDLIWLRPKWCNKQSQLRTVGGGSSSPSLFHDPSRPARAVPCTKEAAQPGMHTYSPGEAGLCHPLAPDLTPRSGPHPAWGDQTARAVLVNHVKCPSGPSRLWAVSGHHHTCVDGPRSCSRTPTPSRKSGHRTREENTHCPKPGCHLCPLDKHCW